MGGHQPIVMTESIPKEPTVLESNQNHATVTDNGVCPTLSASMGMGGGYVPMVTESIHNEVMSTTGGQDAYAIGNGQTAQLRMQDKVGTLNCMHDQIAVMQKLAVENKQLEVCALTMDEDSTDKT